MKFLSAGILLLIKSVVGHDAGNVIIYEDYIPGKTELHPVHGDGPVIKPP
mgnify:CR=1 FL=1